MPSHQCCGSSPQRKSRCEAGRRRRIARKLPPFGTAMSREWSALRPRKSTGDSPSSKEELLMSRRKYLRWYVDPKTNAKWSWKENAPWETRKNNPSETSNSGQLLCGPFPSLRILIRGHSFCRRIGRLQNLTLLRTGAILSKPGYSDQITCISGNINGHFFTIDSVARARRPF